MFIKLYIKKNDKVLDIGCGWGGLILRAAKIPGVKATGITLSQEQYFHTKNLLTNSHLSNHANVQLLDYRSLKGTFDHIFSVEMLEAVGHKGLVGNALVNQLKNENVKIITKTKKELNLLNQLEVINFYIELMFWQFFVLPD